MHRIKAGLDKDGNVVAWRHRIVGQSILTGTPFEAQMVKDGVDATSVEGAATLPYAIPNFQVELHTEKTGVPVLWWRSVGATHTAHATEHMVDILAKEAGKDPVAFRLAMLKDHPRHAGVLKLAAEKAAWGTPPPAGVLRGVAVHESFSAPSSPTSPTSAFATTARSRSNASSARSIAVSPSIRTSSPRRWRAVSATAWAPR